MTTQFLTEEELRGMYGDAVITKLAAGHGSVGVVVAKIGDAEDEARSYVRGYTDVPETPGATSRRLKVLVGALAYYGLHSHLAARPFTVRDERENALKGLALIRSGELSIATASEPGVDIARPAVAVSRRSSRDDAPITLANMRDWR